MASITQRRETESLLFDQQECVTVARLATRLNLSRTDASQLLSSILHDHQQPPPNNNNNNALVVETTTVESCAREVPCSGANNEETGETVPCTVFSLRTKQEKLGSKEEDETDDKDQPRFVYALSPVLNHNKNDESTAAMSLDHHGSSAVASMHEQTLAVWRDMIRQRDTGQLQACVAQAQDMVQAPLSCDEARWAQFQTPSTDLGSVTVSHRSGSAAAGKKKDVTAKAFFGSSKASASSSSTTATAATAKAGSSAKSGATMAKSKKPAKASVRSATTKKQSTKSNSTAAKTSTTTSSLSSAFAKQRTIAEKENKNKQHREKSNAKIGTADDFVGDLEDSDDDDDDDSVAKVVHPPNNAAGKTKIDNDVEMMQVDEEEEGDDPVPKQKHEEEDKQPMEIDNDDDNNKEEDAPPQKRRARRKKLEQVTSMDQKGFLVTETKVVWEDVPSDEEEKSSKATSAKPKPKKKANTGKAPKMKQKSLSSFFKK